MVCRTQTALVLATLALGGCPSDPPPADPTPVPLVDTTAWERVGDLALDFFADERPPDAVCDDSGWTFDPFREALEVQTEVCNYLTLRQVTLEPLAPGDVVTVLAFHDVLTAPEPAQGYLGLAIDGELEWELHVPIPGDAEAIEQEFTIDRTIPEGSEIQVHVHNHGPNSWELIAILVTPQGSS